MASVGAFTALLLLLVMASAVAARSQWSAQELFDADNCTGGPVVVSLAAVSSCTPSQCSSVEINNNSQFVNVECNITDRFAYAEAVFGEFNYIVVEDYAGAGCENLRLTTVLPASGGCAESTLYGTYSIVSVLFANGSALIALYADGGCEGEPYMNFVLDSGNISSGDCVENYYKFYTSASESILGLTSESADAGTSSDSSSSAQKSSSHSGLSGLSTVGLVLAAGAIGFMAAVFFWKRRSPKDEQRTEDSDCIVGYDSYRAMQNRPKSSAFSTGTKSSYSKEGRDQRSISYFWDDDEIAASRVDRDKIDFEGVISHGGGSWEEEEEF
ncbi:hypothetical protein PHYPSEUDO_013620 [Phytophthora pseudosyringae]|uniref:TKL protein kinase n=1 Tax=Phytophthora pseudosyringae TaxID=221518 RepID=A0A8T1W7Y7_9STRA|nr:hypothetical protein PHYPSEUDO_013620 [Phytophthora pseudosyringae]